MRLIGSGKGLCIIDGQGKGDYVIDIQSNQVDIIGFTIKNKQIGKGINIDGYNQSLINNNTIRDTQTGIYITNSKNNKIYYNNLINNTNNAYDD
ncbi:MAG: right-handed parallel beta-helix repeat-containing protein, partial [Thermoplasmatales archaeon]